MGVDGIAYLQTRGPQGVNGEAEINISLSIANLILHSWKIDAEPIQQLILEQPSEASTFGVTFTFALTLIDAEIRTATIEHKCVECIVTGGVVSQISRPRRTFDEAFSCLRPRVSGITGCIFLRYPWHRERGS